MNEFELGREVEKSNILRVCSIDTSVILTTDVSNKVAKCREFLEKKLTEKTPIYGVSTGFGFLANSWIDDSQLSKLQTNLIHSHSSGLGAPIDPKITRTAMILLANSLAKGHSGISSSTLERLVLFINHNIIPVSYEIGSLGASGDLAPLAHVALSLLGDGEVTENGEKYGTVDVLKRHKLNPLNLGAKEGLALINGTHFVTAYSLHLLKEGKMLIYYSILASALSLEALRGTLTSFHALIHNLRPYYGQQEVARLMRKLLTGSEILKSHHDVKVDKKVQDPYSLRCIPQVMGAVIDTLNHLEKILSIEINSVTDNPLIFPDDDLILSGGNFHAEPLAIPLESVKNSLIEMANISESRIDKLVTPFTKETTPFLTQSPGLESGYMIVHYTAAALLNKLRSQAYPSVVDNIKVSGGQEDHVSMGMNSATQTYRVLKEVRQLVAIELLTAVRALNLQEGRPRSTEILEKVISIINGKVPFVAEDHIVHSDLLKVIQLVESDSLDIYSIFD